MYKISRYIAIKATLTFLTETISNFFKYKYVDLLLKKLTLSE